MSISWERPQVSGCGGPYPLSRRHGSVLSGRSDRDSRCHDPVIVFEVLSPSTTRTDRIVKAREYQATPSVQRYVMLEQDGVSATVYARSGEIWTHEILVADSILFLPEIGVELALAELYEGIVFEAEQDADPAPEGEPAEAMPLYFAYGANMSVEAMARRCPRSKALGQARLERHRLAVMREGWLTAAARPALRRARRALGLGAIRRCGARPLRGLGRRPLRQARPADHHTAGAEAGDGLFRRQLGARNRAPRLHRRRPRRGALMAAAG